MAQVFEIFPSGRQGPVYPAVSVMAVDALVTPGARPSATMVLNQLT